MEMSAEARFVLHEVATVCVAAGLVAGPARAAGHQEQREQQDGGGQGAAEQTANPCSMT